MTSPVQARPTPFDFNNFQGFPYPNTTQVPDMLFDHIMQDLDEKELKVLLYIIRRTFGFKKQADNISLNQLVNGITTRDGRILDRGTGLSKATVARALQSLKQKNIINATQNSDPKKGNLPTTYSLKMLANPCLTNETRGVSPVKQAPVSQVRHTINRITTTSTTAAKTNSSKFADSGSDNRNLAAALIDRGIEKRVAHHLAKSYDKKQIENNIDWLEWKQKNDPHSIKINPAGLLRRAIEKDFAAEGHKGFQTRQQKVAASFAKKQRLAAQERLVEAHTKAREASLQQKEKERVKRLETLREKYHTGKSAERLWSQVLETLKEQVPDVSFNTYLASSTLLSLQANKALITVPNRFVKARIEDRLSAKIEQVLGDHLKGQPATIQCLVLDE